MSKTTISTFELFAMFPDQETARVYLEGACGRMAPKCPVCGIGERITARKNGFYRCNQCKEDFTVRTGTIFERSHIPLHKWIYAMYLLLTARKGISSLQLSKEIGIRQASGLVHAASHPRSMRPNLTKLRGIIEIDEIFVGGIESNKHEDKKAQSQVAARVRTKRRFLECARKAAGRSPRQLRTRTPEPSRPKSIGMWKSARPYIPTKPEPMRALAHVF